MPRLPDANDLGQTQFQQTRGVPNVPVADYAGALGTVAKGFAAVGQAAADYADKQQTKFRDEESFKTNLSLLKATDDFNTNTQGLDPSDPQYVEKRSAEWNKVFRPILETVQDPKNRVKFGEWAAENGIKTHMSSVNTAFDAGVEAKKLAITASIQTLQNQIADGKITVKEGHDRVRDIIASSGLTENQRRSIELEQGTAFDANAASVFGLQLIGNAKSAPEGWAPFEQSLGAFAKGMKDKGFEIVSTSHYRTPEYQAKIRKDKYRELLSQGKSDAEAQAYVDKYFAEPSANQPHATGASDLAVKLADGRTYQLGQTKDDQGRDLPPDVIAQVRAATEAAHNSASQYGLVFRLDGKDGRVKEDWHVEPSDKAAADPNALSTVVRSEDAKLNMLAAFKASAPYLALTFDKRQIAEREFLQNYDIYVAKREDEKLLGETRTIVDEIATRYPNPEDRRNADEELRARVKDPVFLEKALVMLSGTLDTNAATKKAEETKAYNDTLDKIAPLVSAKKYGDALKLIPVKGEMNDTDRAKLTEYIRKGGAPTTDTAAVYDQLFGMAISTNHDENIAFANTNLKDYQGLLSPETLDKFRARQEAILKGGGESHIQSNDQIFTSRLTEIGIDPSDKSKETAAVKNRISVLVEHNLQQASDRKNGVKLSESEVSKVIDDTFLQFRGLQKHWYGTSSEGSLNLKDSMERMEKYEKENKVPPGTTLNTIYNNFDLERAKRIKANQDIIDANTDPAAVAEAQRKLRLWTDARVDASFINGYLDKQSGMTVTTLGGLGVE